LAGYNPTAEEVIAAFKLYVQEEAKKYEPEFPNELYREWHRLYDIAVPKRGKPWHFKALTVRHIYYPLADSREEASKADLKQRTSDFRSSFNSGHLSRRRLRQLCASDGHRATSPHVGYP
jgi:hypothetical protein